MACPKKYWDKTTEEETPDFSEGSEDEAAGLMGKDEFSRLYTWGEELGEPTTTIPKAQKLGDGVFQGFDIKHLESAERKQIESK